MILNLLLIGFLIAMLVVWSQYGLFSSFLHLLTVVAAGAIALAFWEPLAQGLLLGRMPNYAWAVGLLAPFVLLLIGLHLVMDRVVHVSVQFPDIANKIGGAAIGVVSGILTAGLLVLGLSFASLPASMAGYQRFTVLGNGQIDTANKSKLWVPVADITAGFYSTLSAGAFSTSTPLAVYKPNLADQAGLYRMRVDPFSSVSLLPGKVSVEAMHTHPTLIPGLPDWMADAFGPEFATKTNQLVVVRTRWNRSPATYDVDGTLRIPPAQVRLVTVDKRTGDARDAELVAPVAFRGKSDLSHQEPYFHPIDSDRSSVYGFNDEEDISFVFIADQNRVPAFLLVRHLRLPLPAEPGREAPQLIAALGRVAPQAEVADTEPQETVNLSEGAVRGPDGVEFAISNKLPMTISKNDATSLSFTNPDDENAITSGSATVSRRASGFGMRRLLTHIDTPAHRPMVRMRISGAKAQEYFGSTGSSQAMSLGVFLTDDRGNTPKPTALVWLSANNTQYIDVKSGGGNFATGNAIGIIPRMASTDDLLLYFPVNRGATIISYQIGQSPPQRLTDPLVVE